MKKDVLSREVAEKEFQDIVDFWDLIPAKDSADSELSNEKIIRAIMQGRLTLNKEEKTFKYTLTAPIFCENDKTISHITLKEVGAASLPDDLDKLSSIRAAIKVLSHAAELPVGVLERLNNRDINILALLLSFFSQDYRV